MKNTVFQFVLFYNPSIDKKDDRVPQIIETGFVFADHAEKAKLIASRKLTSEWDSCINDIEVLVRPF